MKLTNILTASAALVAFSTNAFAQGETILVGGLGVAGAAGLAIVVVVGIGAIASGSSSATSTN